LALEKFKNKSKLKFLIELSVTKKTFLVGIYWISSNIMLFFILSFCSIAHCLVFDEGPIMIQTDTHCRLIKLKVLTELNILNILLYGPHKQKWYWKKETILYILLILLLISVNYVNYLLRTRKIPFNYLYFQSFIKSYIVKNKKKKKYIIIYKR
jgi:hypothetical protein